MILVVTALGVAACVLGMIVTRVALRAQAKLDAIAALEVHGREFVDAQELYTILGKPVPDPIDHAANIRTRIGQPPYRSPYP